ncbi:hypothetical protein Tco_1006579 [Tanacetum coccineum]|uniref:Uncharacterized protein n=1 Tax=Tanacetum coccineum TaxID=301880 RepID=A0ABQ5FIG0_9ASTR
MEILDTMISDAIKKSAGYNYYIAKKKESAKDKIVDKPEEQPVSSVKSELVNSISIQEPHTQRRRRSQLTIDSHIDNAIVDAYAEWGQKLKGPVVEDPTVQSLLDLWKGSKATRLESLKQKKQAVTREGSSNAHNKHYADSDTDNDAILYSSCSEERENETIKMQMLAK